MLEYLSIWEYDIGMNYRDNLSSAGNQQERPYIKIEDIPSDLGWYFTGFSDGEGSFNISFKRELSYGIGWKVALSFNVSQKDVNILKLFQQTLKCGTIRFRQDGVGYFEVRRLDDLKNVIIPFFEHFPLKSKKSKDFEIFKEISEIIFAKEHLTYNGMQKLLSLREPMNSGGKRKFSSKEILELMCVESSTTTRQSQKIDVGI